MHSEHLFTNHAYLKNEIPVRGCAHQAGAYRFGTNPRVGDHLLERLGASADLADATRVA